MIDGLLSGIGSVVPFLVVLGVVVFIHELGHFLVARYFGVAVETFSIGFGPELGGFDDRHGTRWRVAAIPLGGYVKFKGDDNAASVPASREELARMTPAERAGNFHAKPVVQRAAIVAAGPLANFVLSFVLFAGWFGLVGKPVLEPRIGTVAIGSAAERAGFQRGDVVRAIDGQAINSFSEIPRIVMLGSAEPLTFEVDRGGTPVTLTATPSMRDMTDAAGNTGRACQIGLRSAEDAAVAVQRFGPLDAARASLSEIYFWMKQPIIFVREMVFGGPCVSVEQLGGPIRIGQLSKEMADASWLNLINLIAVISVSIGLLNLFPIPLLDGGHLLFYGIEATLGRPLSEGTQAVGFRIGMALVLMLMVFATWNDVKPILGRFGLI